MQCIFKCLYIYILLSGAYVLLINDKNIYEDDKQQIQIIVTFGVRKNNIGKTKAESTVAVKTAKVPVKFKIEKCKISKNSVVGTGVSNITYSST